MPNLTDEDDIDKLVNGALNQTQLRLEFDERLQYLGISFNQARENLGLTYRGLNGILDGLLEQVDMMALIKIAQFLELPNSEAARLYADALVMKRKDEFAESERRTFIINNFDLPTLKVDGIIDSIRDFDLIESQLNDFLGLEKILDFKSDEAGVAYWLGSKTPKNDKARKLFVGRSKSILRIIDNPFEYQKDYLISYFQKIRWQSIDLENGLLTVMRELYKLGVTVLFLPKNKGLSMRGATFSINNKPCIVLTDYRGFYPTLWYALLHELFHVLFDWEEIKKEKFHLSLDGVDNGRELEANEFARDYFIPNKKTNVIYENIDDREFIRNFALENQIHPSLIYGHCAFVLTTKEKNLWEQFKTQRLFPRLSYLVNILSGNSDMKTNPTSYAAYYAQNIFNQ